MAGKCLRLALVFSFAFSLITPIPPAQASPLLGLPEPGTMVSLSSAYQPAMIKGLSVHQDNPFQFDFIVDVGQDHLAGQALKNEGEKLIKYFMASLAVPEKDTWVNLSPYEKDRIIPQGLGQTDMGRDMLAQDYLLKQLTASLIYPEKGLGKDFWERVYAKADGRQVPVSAFNKVWITADKAEVFERNNTAFVVNSHLKVMLEEDYLAAAKNVIPAKAGIQNASSQVMRDIIIPELEREVNEGRNFANLRQIFNSLILAAWYKNALKQSVLSQVYADKNKVNGIDLQEKGIEKQIYQRYLEAFKKGVFNFVKEDPADRSAAPRKYFSGGVTSGAAARPLLTSDEAQLADSLSGRSLMSFNTGFDAAQLTRLVESNAPIARFIVEAFEEKSASLRREPGKNIFSTHISGFVISYDADHGNWSIKQDSLKGASSPAYWALSWDGKGILEAFFTGDGGILSKDIALKADPFITLIKDEKDAKLILSDEAVDKIVEVGYGRVLLGGFSGLKVRKQADADQESMPLDYVTMTDGLREFLRQAGIRTAAQLRAVEKPRKMESIKAMPLRKAQGFIREIEELKATLQYADAAMIGRREVLILATVAAAGLAGASVGPASSEQKKIMASLDPLKPLIKQAIQETLTGEERWRVEVAAASSIAIEKRNRLVVSLPVVNKRIILPKETAALVDALKPTVANLGFREIIIDHDGSGIIYPIDQAMAIITESFDRDGAMLAEFLPFKSRAFVWDTKSKVMILIGFVSALTMLGYLAKAELESNARLKEYGGIDLNAANMGLKISKDAAGGVKMDVDQAMIERIRKEGVEGLTPVIFSITPVASIWPLVGINR